MDVLSPRRMATDISRCGLAVDMVLLYDYASFERDEAVVLTVDEAEVIGSIGLTFEDMAI